MPQANGAAHVVGDAAVAPHVDALVDQGARR